MSDDVKNEVYDVLAQHDLCVLSTVTADAKPQSAIVGFSHGKDLQLLIGTSHKTRKYANLQQNQHVSVVVGDTASEVQYEGTVRQLEEAELEQHIGTHFEKLPGSAKYIEGPEQVWLLVTPTWLRLTVHEGPDRIVEIEDFA